MSIWCSLRASSPWTTRGKLQRQYSTPRELADRLTVRHIRLQTIRCCFEDNSYKEVAILCRVTEMIYLSLWFDH